MRKKFIIAGGVVLVLVLVIFLINHRGTKRKSNPSNHQISSARKRLKHFTQTEGIAKKHSQMDREKDVSLEKFDSWLDEFPESVDTNSRKMA